MMDVKYVNVDSEVQESKTALEMWIFFSFKTVNKYINMF